jgi:tRNA pseudouridine55 synthase
MLDADKEYLATVRLGVTTTTADAEGEVLEQRPVDIGAEQVAKVVSRFRGPIDQLPPMYSALKRDGVPLYEHARAGRTIERATRRVEIHELDVLQCAPPILELRVRCSKGTYIRTLAEDIGAALGTGAHLAALRRTASGRFDVRNAFTLDDLRAMPDRRPALLPLKALLQGLPSTELDAVAEARLRNGQSLKISGLEAGLLALYGANGQVIGLGQALAEGLVKPLRLTQAAEKHRKTL